MHFSLNCIRDVKDSDLLLVLSRLFLRK